MRKILLRTLQILFTAAFLFVLSASGAILTVTKTADTSDGACDSDCSLREAIAAAADGDTIEFASPLFDSPQVIGITGGNEATQPLFINKSIVINGRGANLLTVRRAAGASSSRIFSVNLGGSATLQNMTVSGGRDSGGGGGILLDNGTLTVNNCAITGNVAQARGGGIYNAAGTLNVFNSTLNGNIAGIFNGGAIASFGGTVNLVNSTVSGNSTNAGNVGTGGVWVSGGALNVTGTTVTDNETGGIIQEGSAVVTIKNSIVAANRNNSSKPDVVGAFVSNGYNLIGNADAATGFNETGDQTGTSSAPIDPRLAPLGDFGGRTPTHALLRGSPAINAAGPDNFFRNDQRDIPHNIGGAADIGAFEYNFAFSNNPTGAGGVGTLPVGSLEIPYSVRFSAARLFRVTPSIAFKSNNLAPLVFSIIDGSLPSGLTLDSNSGVLSGTPTQRGIFNFIVKVTDAADGIGGAQAYSLIVSGPTAANVSINGRVLTPDGRGLRNARITLTDMNGATRTFLTTTFGFYRFDEITAGQTVIVSVASKRYSFQPRILNPTHDLEDLNFTAQENSSGEIKQ